MRKSLTRSSDSTANQQVKSLTYSYLGYLSVDPPDIISAGCRREPECLLKAKVAELSKTAFVGRGRQSRDHFYSPSLHSL